jgi:hypothetical protein
MHRRCPHATYAGHAPGMRRASCMPLDGSCQRLRVAQCQRLIDSGPCTARPAPMMHIDPLAPARTPRRGLGPDPHNCRALCLRHPHPQQQSTCPTTSTTALPRARPPATKGPRRPEAAAHASHPHCRRPMRARRPCCLFAPAPAVEVHPGAAGDPSVREDRATCPAAPGRLGPRPLPSPR